MLVYSQMKTYIIADYDTMNVSGRVKAHNVEHAIARFETSHRKLREGEEVFTERDYGRRLEDFDHWQAGHGSFFGRC